MDQLPLIDNTLYELAPNDTLPSTLADINKNHIYLVKADTTGTNNVYAEYIYTGTSATYDATKWEKLGEVTASVDLSGYYTKTDADKKITSEINKHRINTIGFVPATDDTGNLQLKLTEYQGEKVGPTTIPAVTASTNGLMSPTLLTKLNGIATGANNYVHPNSSAGDKKIGLYKIATDAQGHVIEATDVTKDDLDDAELIPEMSVNAITKTATENKLTITYNEIPHITTFATATSKEAGLLSADLFNKLSGLYSTPLTNTVTADDISHAVTGKAVSTAINNHIVNNNNLESVTTGDYHIIGQSDNTNNAAALVNSLKYYYNATDHSTLRIDGSAVWDEQTLIAITNDELTKILV